MLNAPPFPVVVLSIVFLLIAVRQINIVKLRIWQIVVAGAAVIMATGQISLQAAVSYIDPTVIVFLASIFVVGEALTESGYAQHLFYSVFKPAKSVGALVLIVLFSVGVASMFLLNDTLAVIGTPVVLMFAKKERINPKLMLLSLAFAVTIGSVASPIGNPQNILIASSGDVGNPFITFFSYLLLPTMINLLLAYAVLRLFYKKEFGAKRPAYAKMRIADEGLARLCKVSLLIIGVLVAADIAIVSLGLGGGFSLAYIAAMAALPLLALSKKRATLLKNIDWPTIAFFVALFVLVGSVWQSGFVQGLASGLGAGIGSVPVVLVASVLGSQLVSNVPMVLLYLKLLAFAHISTASAMALAAGSTIAGNMFILGAASNVIIIQGAERRRSEALTFMDFARVGVLLTAINVFVYWVFLSI